jgi:hypothetical protein
MYNYGKIFAPREDFIGDVTRKLVGKVARALYEELLTRPVGRKYLNRVHLRGAEKGRTFQFRSDVVEDWLDTDGQKMAERWSDTVIPDYVLQRDVGTFDASTFQGKMKEQILELIERGEVFASDADHMLHSSIDQVQTMLNNMCGLNYLPSGAVWNRRT